MGKLIVLSLDESQRDIQVGELNIMPGQHKVLKQNAPFLADGIRKKLLIQHILMLRYLRFAALWTILPACYRTQILSSHITLYPLDTVGVAVLPPKILWSLTVPYLCLDS